jgi:hypothetical protein
MQEGCLNISLSFVITVRAISEDSFSVAFHTERTTGFNIEPSVASSIRHTVNNAQQIKKAAQRPPGEKNNVYIFYVILIWCVLVWSPLGIEIFNTPSS